MKTINESTTLAELELRLRSFGLHLTAALEGDGRVYCVVTDELDRHGEAYGATLGEAISSAFDTYALNVFGPNPTRVTP